MIALDLVGILASTVTGMALGALWYSPVLFGAAWMRCIGKTPETLGSLGVPMAGSIAANALTAVGISLLFSLAGVADLPTATTVGLVLGLLIVFPALLSDNLFCGWGSKLLLIQAGYRCSAVFSMSLVMYYV